MKTLSLWFALVGMWLVAGQSAHVLQAASWRHAPSQAPVTQAPKAADRNLHDGAIPPSELTEVVKQYCVVCHNARRMTGNLSLQDFSVENAAGEAETAERMIRKLRAGMMPPPGQRRPGEDTLDALAEALEADVDEAARSAMNVGVRRFQRLSRAEYERVIHDLLGLDVDASKWLPPDILVGSFDNMSAAQALSTTLLGSYMRAATEIARLAVGNPGAASSTRKHANPMEVSQHAWDHVDGAPFGTRGGMVVTHHFPADGEYVFQVSTRFGSGNQTSMEDVDISIDGEPVALLMLEHNAGVAEERRIADDDIPVSSIPPIRTEPIFVRAGQRQVSAAFVNLIDGPYEDRFSPPEWSHAGIGGSQYGVTGLTHLTELLITGPVNVSGVSDTDSRRRVFTCRPTGPTDEQSCAESILTRLATQAYRRPPSPQDLADLMEVYDEAAAEEGFEIGVRTGLQGILVAPKFLFRLEREPEKTSAERPYRLDDLDLASRLSFFLWATGPDAELIGVAERGRLSEPDVLRDQVERMLADPRSEALATRFAHQWLRLQDVGKVWPESFLYPDFSQQLAGAMVRETESFFHNLVAEDRSLLTLFDADYSFLNERLARHYAIPGVVGEELRRVEYPGDQRRGVMSHGSVLTLTSMSGRTSPVLRGKWVMEVLMGSPPPPPPPNIPAFEESPEAASGRSLTTRERLEQHRRSPQCRSCHDFIDPIGLALDNFDVTGAWRVRENNQPLDTRGVFYDGTSISTPSELVDVLLERPIPLVRNFTEQLLTYAIGRPATYLDQPTIRAIERAAEANEYKMSSLIMGVVTSDPFRMRHTQDSAKN